MKNALKIATLALVGSAFIGGETEGMKIKSFAQLNQEKAARKAATRQADATESERPPRTGIIKSFAQLSQEKAMRKEAARQTLADATESERPSRTGTIKSFAQLDQEKAMRKAAAQRVQTNSNDALLSTLNTESENNGINPPPPPAPLRSQHRLSESDHNDILTLKEGSNDEAFTLSEAAENGKTNNTNGHSSSARIKDFQSESAKYSQNEEDLNEENSGRSEKDDINSESDKIKPVDDENQSDSLSVHESNNESLQLNEEEEIVDGDMRTFNSAHENDGSIHDDEIESGHQSSQQETQGSQMVSDYVARLDQKWMDVYMNMYNALDQEVLHDGDVQDVLDLMGGMRQDCDAARFYPELFGDGENSLFVVIRAVAQGDVSLSGNELLQSWRDALVDLTDKAGLFQRDDNDEE